MDNISLLKMTCLENAISKATHHYKPDAKDINGDSTLCTSCDRTGCKRHVENKDKPVPCSMMYRHWYPTENMQYAIDFNDSDVKIQVLSCVDYIHNGKRVNTKVPKDRVPIRSEDETILNGKSV